MTQSVVYELTPEESDSLEIAHEVVAALSKPMFSVSTSLEGEVVISISAYGSCFNLTLTRDMALHLCQSINRGLNR